MIRKQSRSDIRVKKHNRMRNKIQGTAQRPRLSVLAKSPSGTSISSTLNLCCITLSVIWWLLKPLRISSFLAWIIANLIARLTGTLLGCCKEWAISETSWLIVAIK